MAGEPAPLAAVQAAVMKQAAGHQAQQPAVTTIAPGGAVARDLSVMADQAKFYTEGTNAGNNIAEQNRAAQSQRLAQEAAAAEAQRNARMEAQRLETQRVMQSIQLDQQRTQSALTQRMLEAELGQKEAEREAEILDREEKARRVTMHAAANYGEFFNTTLNSIVRESTTPQEAMSLFDNMKRYNPELGLSRSITRQYVQNYFNALDGKDPQLDRLTKDKKKPKASTASSSPPLPPPPKPPLPMPAPPPPGPYDPNAPLYPYQGLPSGG